MLLPLCGFCIQWRPQHFYFRKGRDSEFREIHLDLNLKCTINTNMRVRHKLMVKSVDSRARLHFLVCKMGIIATSLTGQSWVNEALKCIRTYHKPLCVSVSSTTKEQPLITPVRWDSCLQFWAHRACISGKAEGCVVSSLNPNYVFNQLNAPGQDC